ncbi:bifunctional AP-4-A phosphorylase/ADP sulfurylase [Didymosphaeria variabile]|uniref:Bifunctional AP-4-A phosphorylase/ADP sulfurylase n=1 Tax=Didymosphaeria variabile TaxID=1932322 RepID=A0A9W9CDU1_9PLEO|nr:bifunctional AP-4-A phosphorylase/ADP sulfurylase [Didymosphaeria variabile]KAJ4357275.1 bifunctional AP-4-A phosphorylase/ADP sulfurylase [Didymosphaeria variabile]
MEQPSLVRAISVLTRTQADQPKQQQQQQREPAVDMHTQAWPTDGLPRRLNPHTYPPATGGFFSNTSPSEVGGGYNSMFMNTMNAQAYSLNHSLPMASPMIMSDADYQSGLNNQLDYTGTLAGRSTMVKSETNYTDGAPWALPMRQPVLLQSAGTADVSDFDTATSSLSPRSTYFSEPSERGATYSPIPGREKTSASGTWAEHSSVSPSQVKQSPSQSISPGFGPQLTYAVGGGMGSGPSSSHSATVGIAPSVGRQYETGFGSQVDQFSLTWATSVGQTDGVGSMAWQPSMYQEMQQSPYYNTGFVNPFQNSAHHSHTHSSGSNARAGAVVQSREPSHELQRQVRRQETNGVSRSTVEQSQRDAENRILMDGKAAELTYKEIRARIVARFPGSDVAESTLRGRHRSLTKQKKDRVRKPTWTSKDLVEAKFTSARASQALVFSPTELSIIRTSAGIPFQLRYCPALAKKPEPRKETTPKKKVDPFENPPAELFITDVPTTNPSHFLVLNKFPVITNHFILATKSNKQQTHVLEEDDLEATYACLKAWQGKDNSGRLFAFFNSGNHSGASQPHRHLQFLPVDSMHEGEKSAGWDVLIDSILSNGAEDASTKVMQHEKLPFTHFAYRFPSEPSAAQLLQTYNFLYQHAKQAIDGYISTHPGQLSLHESDGGDLPISYNLAMTTAGMAIIPRRSEGHMLRRDDGTDIGFVQLNGTVLGGTLMVKFQEEWDILRQHPEKLDAILEAIGLPKPTETTKL